MIIVKEIYHRDIESLKVLLFLAYQRIKSEKRYLNDCVCFSSVLIDSFVLYICLFKVSFI